MMPTAIIVFREVLEAAIVIGIVLAASRGIARRGVWVSGGVGAGLVGAGLVAIFAQSIAAAAAGMGQEVFNASVLFAATAMLAWHNAWMRRHGHEIASHMAAVGQAVRSGSRPLYILAVVVLVAVLREGAEVVLFLYGIAAAGAGGVAQMLGGGLLGLGGGVAVGAVLYFGIARIPLRHLFAVTAWLLVLLAAGMAAQGAGYLVQAGILPALGHDLWDTSALLSERSFIGRILHVLVGYIARPDGVQVMFYVGTIAIIAALVRFAGRPPVAQRTTDGTADPAAQSSS